MNGRRTCSSIVICIINWYTCHPQSICDSSYIIYYLCALVASAQMYPATTASISAYLSEQSSRALFAAIYANQSYSGFCSEGLRNFVMPTPMINTLLFMPVFMTLKNILPIQQSLLYNISHILESKQLSMIQQQKQGLLRAPSVQSNASSQTNGLTSSVSNQIREVRLRKQLQFLKPYDYLVQNNDEGTQITIRNLWTQEPQQYSQLHFGQSIVGTELKVFLPSQYPFKQPTFSHNKQEPLSISQLIDQWSPRFKIMEMIELIKKRVQQRNQLQNYLSKNFVFKSFKAIPSLWIWILLAIMLRIIVGFGSYSGKGDWPNLGDLQAHRNWMSVSLNRPIESWYTQISRQPWWRIDYPPIAAYLSILFGSIYAKIQPKSLLIQRGYESSPMVSYMRATVLLVDCLFLIPAIYLICKQTSPLRYRHKPLLYALMFCIMIKPDQILIDHGHFQYNCLMLGLILYSFYFMLKGRNYLCCILFTIAINCKLMSVYFSLAFFAALIGRTLKKFGIHNKSRIIRQCAIYGMIVITTVFIIWLPWVRSLKTFTSVLQAIFPVHRGLYQLKVPNFWCISDVILKYEAWISKPMLTFLCFVLCIIFSIPSMIALILKPTQKVLIFGFSCISMTFFMFSYHVHEKSILVPLCIIPFVSQYIGGSIVLDLVVGGCAGMYHLLKEDGQKLQYFVMLVIYILYAVAFYQCQDRFIHIYHPHSHQAHIHHSVQQQTQKLNRVQYYHKKYFDMGTPLHLISVFGGLIVLHLGEYFITPPSRLPYLWNLMFAFYSFMLNSYFMFISNLILVEEVKDKIIPRKKD